MNISDPIPPEVSPLDAITDFTDLAKRKLKVAKQQKEKLTSIPITADSRLSEPKSWAKERKLLLNLLEKTQGLVKLEQAKSRDEKNALNEAIEHLTSELELARVAQKHPAKINQPKEDFEPKEKPQPKEAVRPKQELTAAIKRISDLEKKLTLKGPKKDNPGQQKSVENIVKNYTEKETALIEEIQRLHSNHKCFTKTSLSREQNLQQQINQLTSSAASLQHENSELLCKLNSLEKHMITAHSESLQLYKTLSTRYEEGQGPSKYSELTTEVAHLTAQLAAKECELESLQFTSPCPLPVSAEFLCELSVLHCELSTLSGSLESLEVLQATAESSHLQEIQSLTAESHSLKQELSQRSYSAETSQLKVDLSNANLEKNHAKRLLILYIRSIQQLETDLKSSKSPEVSRLSQEIERLSAENRSLANALREQELAYQGELQTLQELTTRQNTLLREANNKCETLRQNGLQDTQQELAATHARCNTLISANTALSSQLQLLHSEKLAGLRDRTIQELQLKLENHKENALALKEQWLQEKQALKQELADRSPDYQVASALKGAYEDSLNSLATTTKALAEITEALECSATSLCALHQTSCSATSPFPQSRRTF